MVEYKPNQIVYAYHGPLIYEAKILKLKNGKDSFIINQDFQHEPLEEKSNSTPHHHNHHQSQHIAKFDPKKWQDQTCYYLHYQGWNSKWDEWVGIDRIMEFNEENKFKKLELDQLTKKKKAINNNEIIVNTTNKNHGNNKNKKESNKRKSTTTTTTTAATSTTTNNSNNKKQKSASTIATNSNSSSGSASTSTTKSKQLLSRLNLNFPPELKHLLVNDWEFITKDRKLISLPSQYPINQILQDYKTYRTKQLTLKLTKNSYQLSILIEILTGLEIYFNKSLSLILLYKYEHLQYLNFLKENIINPQQDILQSNIYGLEHLLRLIISFPGLLSMTTMDGISLSVLILELESLCRFIGDRLQLYQNKYEFTSPQYDSLARS